MNQHLATMPRTYLFLILVAAMACTPKVRTSITAEHPALAYDEQIAVLGVTDAVPPGVQKVGVVKVGDTGFSNNCGMGIVMQKAKLAARKAGGNLLKINEHTPPNFGSTCHRIEADILRFEDKSQLEALRAAMAPVDTTWNYAKLHVYRSGGSGFLVGYNVHLGDSVLCRVKNKSSHTVTITKAGIDTLWATTESRTEVPIDIEFGREYYLRCGIGTGIVVGRPTLELVGPQVGSVEYQSINDIK